MVVRKGFTRLLTLAAAMVSLCVLSSTTCARLHKQV